MRHGELGHDELGDGRWLQCAPLHLHSHPFLCHDIDWDSPSPSMIVPRPSAFAPSGAATGRVPLPPGLRSTPVALAYTGEASVGFVVETLEPGYLELRFSPPADELW